MLSQIGILRSMFIAVATAAVVLPAMAADLATRFTRISIGLTREQVLVLMETQPASVVESSTLGVARARLRWQEGPRGPAYAVVLIAGRVVQTESCDPASDC